MIDRGHLDASLMADVLDRLGPVAVTSAVRDARGTVVDFRFELVNEAFCEALREPVDVLVGARLLELYPSHRELGLFDAYRDVVETGEPFDGELPWFDERNVHAFFAVRVVKFRDGYLMTGSDLTEAKMAEQVREVFEAAPEVDLRRGADVLVGAGATDTAVEVWCRYTNRWVSGFWLDATSTDGSVQVRRGSDRTALPRSFPADSVRPAQEKRRGSAGWTTRSEIRR